MEWGKPLKVSSAYWQNTLNKDEEGGEVNNSRLYFQTDVHISRLFTSKVAMLQIEIYSSVYFVALHNPTRQFYLQSSSPDLSFIVQFYFLRLYKGSGCNLSSFFIIRYSERQYSLVIPHLNLC
jgi:hypothetical protein